VDIKELAIYCNRSYNTLYRIADTLGIKGKKHTNGKRNWTQEQADALKKHFEPKHVPKISTDDVARMLECSTSSVFQYSKKIGISFNKRYPHDFTEYEIERLRFIIPKKVVYAKKTPAKKEKELDYHDPAWWPDPTPRSLCDDWEENND
jgi:hypothetical protein